MSPILHSILLLPLVTALSQIPISDPAARAGNPVFPGWYPDPEARIFNNRYWVYPTYSAAYEEQTFFDAFSSPDLDTDSEFDYYFYFSAGDGAGIGVAKSTTGRPEGSFVDVLGKPLVGETVYGGQPIDAQVFDDDDGRVWLYFGGWSHAVVVELNDDMVSLKGEYLEITPEGYVEGPWMLKRNGIYYFMYSVGGWGDNSYGVSYVTGPSPTGPFSSTPTKILSGNDEVGTGTGHHSVFTPDGEDYYIVYHRRYLNDTARDHRVVCIDRMEFDAEGNILPVTITTEGVTARAL